MTDTTATSPHAPLPWFAALQGMEKGLLVVGLLLQFTVLGGMVGKWGWARFYGDVYLVRVVPVDPRDLMRGDYVILGYEFSRLPPAALPGLRGDLLPETPVYVRLVPEGDGRHWRGGAFSLTPPEDGPYLRGTWKEHGRIEYGIESYFVEEGQGRRYEDAARSRHLSAEIGVLPNGEARLRALLIEP